MEVYHLLNQLRADDAKFYSNPEILWRISRALYVMSQNDLFSKSICEEMIQEAYRLIRFALSVKDDNAEVHKWNAILIDSTAGYLGIYTRIRVIPDVKKHLLHAAELKPSDVTTLYMLGHLCYQLASLTWFQRKLANLLLMSPPCATYEEAYNYFLMVEKLQPRFSISNTFMLGKVSFHMKQCYRAKYYFDIAASLPYRTEQEKKYSQEAKKLSKELHRYDVSKAALFYGWRT
ncbi:hypothetical protein ILUMI_04733 [Ignelater luminosus]|uniref:Regulator of microtubule dynamics protein 1 n=1 Tax=Ignelater luminosus TaxID=2038154 RepID=A0A8K0DDB3_IGNLU|nr:hypothetical protein ILUMI_04733 [Ignelater luminosus]